MRDTWTAIRGVSLLSLLIGGCGDDSGPTGTAGATDSGTTGGAPSTNDDTSGTAASTTSHDATSGTEGETDAEDSGSTGASTTDAEESTSGGSEESSTSGESSASESQGESEAAICEAPGNPTPCDADSDDPFHAIGLNCPGGQNETIPISNEAFVSPDAQAWRVARQFGSHVDPNTSEPYWSAKEGEKFLIISTGHIAAPDANGVITMPNGSHYVTNANPNAPLPAPMNPANGSSNGAGGTPFVDCDGIGDCSDTLANQWSLGNSLGRDLLWFQFETVVPGGTHGFTFDFAYFSREFPYFVNHTFNDMFVVWSNSETYTGNLCFIQDEPCTVRALHPADFIGAAPQLAGTGFYDPSSISVGGATAWYQAKASAAPGETLQLTWAVFDMGDNTYDTAVIIDNFQWDCEGCVPSEVNPCGVEPVPT